MNPLVIFSDLDGTLLDHHDYSFDAAIETLNNLKRLHIPCILNTSKTYAELEILQEILQLNLPFIVENGSAVYIPKSYNLQCSSTMENNNHYYRKTFGPRRNTILELVAQVKEEFSFTGFAEMNSTQLAKASQLSLHTAELALQREFTEPLLWQDTKKAFTAFKKIMESHGLQIQKGGRFIHLMGKKCDKAMAMNWLSECYKEHYQNNITTMALGDGNNDVGMISHADIGVIIRSPVNPAPTIPNRTDIYVTEGYGPVGWAQAVNRTLENNLLL